MVSCCLYYIFIFVFSSLQYYTNGAVLVLITIILTKNFSSQGTRVENALATVPCLTLE